MSKDKSNESYGWNDPPKSCFTQKPDENVSKFDYRRRASDMRALNSANMAQSIYRLRIFMML